MSIRKAQEIIGSFDAYEKNQFKKFLESPYFNQKVELSMLFDILSSLKKSKKSEEEEYPDIFHKIYGKTLPYNSVKMNHLFSSLLKCVEEYLMIQELGMQEQLKKLNLIKAYRKRSLKKHFDYHYYDKKKQTKNSQKDSESFFYEYLLLQEEYHLYANTERFISQMQHMNDALNNHFIVNSLKQACQGLALKNISNVSYHQEFLDVIVQYLDKNPPEDYLIQIYHQIFLLYSEKDQVSLDNLLTLFMKNKQTIFDKERKDIHYLLISFIIKKLNLGRSQPLEKVLLTLYQIGLDEGFILENNQLSPFTYRNISTIAILNKEYDWCFEFIHHYKTSLPLSLQDSFYHFCLSKYYFAIKDFKQSAQNMNKVNTEDILTMLNAKATLIKAYYELNDSVFADYQLQRLKQFLWRKNLSTYHKTNYQNFIKYVNLLLNLNISKKDKIMTEIQQEKILTEKEWLIEKIKQAKI